MVILYCQKFVPGFTFIFMDINKFLTKVSQIHEGSCVCCFLWHQLFIFRKTHFRFFPLCALINYGLRNVLDMRISAYPPWAGTLSIERSNCMTFDSISLKRGNFSPALIVICTRIRLTHPSTNYIMEWYRGCYRPLKSQKTERKENEAISYIQSYFCNQKQLL